MIEERMSVDEYHLLPGDPAWKVEYYDGKAVWEPRHNLVTLTVPVTLREAPLSSLVRPLKEVDRAGLQAGYVEAFTDAIDFFGYSADAIARSAARDIGAAYEEDPAIRAASHVAMDGLELVGAALLARYDTGPHLNVLFVRAGWRRRNLATSLAASALSALHGQRETKLSSFHHIGNEASAAWHRSFGFVELPDVMNARLRWHAHVQNLSRDDHFRALSAAARRELERQIAETEAEVDRLTEIENIDFEAVHPIMRYRRRAQRSLAPGM